MKSVQDWPGDSIPIRSWLDAVDIACLIGGVDPAGRPERLLLRAATTSTSPRPIRTWSS